MKRRLAVIALMTAIVGCFTPDASQATSVNSRSRSTQTPADVEVSRSSAKPMRGTRPDPSTDLANTATFSPSTQVTQWLDALRQGASLQLRELSAFPFELRDTGAARGCPNRATSVDSGNLESLVDCLFNDKLLLEELQSQFPPPSTVVDREALPAWASAWRKEPGPDAIPVEIELIGDGITFHLVVLSSPIGVRGVWKHAEFHPEGE